MTKTHEPSEVEVRGDTVDSMLSREYRTICSFLFVRTYAKRRRVCQDPEARRQRTMGSPSPPNQPNLVPVGTAPHFFGSSPLTVQIDYSTTFFTTMSDSESDSPETTPVVDEAAVADRSDKKRGASEDNAEAPTGDFADENLQCRDCEGEFVFSAEEQEFFDSKGFTNKPVRCKDCRSAKKQRMDGDRGGDRGGRGGGGDRACYNCGQTGHLSYECTEAKKEGAGGPARSCYNCGQEGHISRDCTGAKKEGAGPPGGGDRACYNCGQTGHMSYDCAEPKSGGGGGGGRGRGGGGRGRGGGGRGRGGGGRGRGGGGRGY